jgi:TRAP-type C4-dicarboxylate transport system permease small subunit
VRALDRAVEVLIGLGFVALIVTAFGQVVGRYLLSYSLAWVLEFDVLVLVWVTLLSGYVGVRRNLHMAVDFCITGLSPANRRRMAIANHLLCALFVAVFGWHSFAVIDSMQGIPFASLPVAQPALYWSLPVGAALMLIALAVEIAKQVRTPVGN